MKPTSRLDIPLNNQVRSHEDYMVIGCVCKYGDVFSLAVLIDRGLDQRNSVGRVRIRETEDEMHLKSMVRPYLEAKRNL